MLKQSARVVAAERDGLWIEARGHQACQGCRAAASCGHALQTAARSGRVSLLKLAPYSAFAPRVGAQVTLSVPEALVLKLSLLFCLVPLAALLAGSLLAARLGGGEAATMLGGATGLAGGLLAARGAGRRLETRP